jgi:hypothetical protein
MHVSPTTRTTIDGFITDLIDTVEPTPPSRSKHAGSNTMDDFATHQPSGASLDATILGEEDHRKLDKIVEKLRHLQMKMLLRRTAATPSVTEPNLEADTKTGN